MTSTLNHMTSPLCHVTAPHPQQDESSRRHDQQLEHIKEKVCLAVSSVAPTLSSLQAAGSRHTSCEEAPCVVPYPRCKWCTLCSVPVGFMLQGTLSEELSELDEHSEILWAMFCFISDFLILP